MNVVGKQDIKANFECPDCGRKWSAMFEPYATQFIDRCITKPKCLSDRKPLESYDVKSRELGAHKEGAKKLVSGTGESIPIIGQEDG